MSILYMHLLLLYYYIYLLSYYNRVEGPLANGPALTDPDGRLSRIRLFTQLMHQEAPYKLTLILAGTSG